MSLAFDNIHAIPQTHIFIIGVGGYPYLKDGTMAVPQTFAGVSDLNQLTSPAVSAEAFFEMAMALHQKNEWIKPLGSIELLVSTAPGGKAVFAGQQLQPATMVNIQTAYQDWKTRCDSSEDNVALFFYSGHGMQKSEHYLLAEDFGKNPANPWLTCFDFDNTRLAFQSCKAKTQVFFIDACRQLTADMLTYLIQASAIEPPSIFNTECQYNLTMKAAAANESAYGRKNEPSFFTSALVGALKGNVATNPGNGWTIGTGSLSSSINTLLEIVAPGQGFKQRCISTISDTIELIKLSNTPDVLLNVSCDPDLALPMANLSCKNLNTNQISTRVPQPDPWEISVQAGLYHLEAKFTKGPYKPGFSYAYVTPPISKGRIKCPT